MAKKHEELAPTRKPPVTHDGVSPDRAPGPATSPDQLDQIAAATTGWKIAAPPEINVGETVENRVLHSSTQIFALGSEASPRCYMRVKGDPAIELEGAPMYLPSASKPYDEQNSVKLKFQPTRVGRFASTLEVIVTDAPVQQFEIPLVAAAHAAGAPTLSEQAAIDADTATAEAKEREDAAAADRVRKAIHDEEQLDTHYHAGHLRRLDNARIAAQVAINAVYENRQHGIESARALVGDFHRLKPAAEKPSLLAELAWIAVDVATARIASGVAKSAESILGAVLSRPELGDGVLPRGKAAPPQISLGKTVIGFVSESLKAGTKAAAGVGKRALKDGGGAGHRNPHQVEIGDDVRIEFFRMQADQLVGETSVQALEVSTNIHDALLPVLRTNPELAISQMQAIAGAFKAQVESASVAHQEQGVQKWIRYVADTNGADQSDAPYNESHPHAHYDGLIDIMIKPDPFHPEAPVVVSGARLEGVSAAAVRTIQRTPLAQLGMTVRAAGDFNSPTSTLTVLRRSDASVSYAHTEGGEERAWLEKKARAHGRGPDALWGARILLEDEVMDKTLEKLGGRGGPVNDSE